MKKGYLSQYFDGVAIKELSAVESDVLTSNQHEFNGVDGLKKILGEPDGKVKYEARFIYLSDYDEEPIVENGFLTWYDARQKARIERGIMRWEYRLYFPTNLVSQCTNAGDILVIAKRPNNTLLAIVAESKTTIAHQLIWLFGFSEVSHPGFTIREKLETEQDRLEFASRLILESLGILIEFSEETYLEDMLSRFNGEFPTTREFSNYARSTLLNIASNDEHDSVLMFWMEREEILFRTLEKYIIEKRLSQGFNGDVEGFISFSLSVQNRRKSRVGLALENHLEFLFKKCGIRYSRGSVTENKSKPDFIFPGKMEYHDLTFNALNLTMLGVKSSCKDRWRQVLAEADRIKKKHLLTLEASISKNQTDEMAAKDLQLVLPKKIHSSYLPEQQSWIMSISEFINNVLSKQK
ncbi:MAG: restriction endonuclease [SAR324 cluster bacterium]|nr:restriction endonuclease [SAR324 cluster bacterium]